MSEEMVDMDTEPCDDEPDTIAEDAEAEAEDSGYDSLPEVKAMEEQIKSAPSNLNCLDLRAEPQVPFAGPRAQSSVICSIMRGYRR